MNTKNLKPFDLQAALSGKAVMLRDGAKAFVRHHETEFPIAEDTQLWGIVLPECAAASWTAQGTWRNGGGEHKLDIIGMYPETRIINGFEVPVPETKALKDGSRYYAASIDNEYFYESYTWYGDSFDFRMLERGLVFLNKDNAIANAKAMLGIDPYKEGE